MVYSRLLREHDVFKENVMGVASNLWKCLLMETLQRIGATGMSSLRVGTEHGSL